MKRELKIKIRFYRTTMITDIYFCFDHRSVIDSTNVESDSFNYFSL